MIRGMLAVTQEMLGYVEHCDFGLIRYEIRGSALPAAGVITVLIRDLDQLTCEKKCYQFRGHFRRRWTIYQLFQNARLISHLFPEFSSGYFL